VFSGSAHGGAASRQAVVPQPVRGGQAALRPRREVECARPRVLRRRVRNDQNEKRRDGRRRRRRRQ